MEYVKRLAGLAVGTFSVLVVAWICSTCLNVDFKWYYLLDKPIVVPSGAIFTLMVSVVYVLHTAVVSRLVVGKHFFPSTLILGGVGVFSILFVFSFFTLKNVYLAATFMAVTFALSLIQTVRFFIKELRIALYYLPIFAFNCYAFILSLSIAFTN